MSVNNPPGPDLDSLTRSQREEYLTLQRQFNACGRDEKIFPRQDSARLKQLAAIVSPSTFASPISYANTSEFDMDSQASLRNASLNMPKTLDRRSRSGVDDTEHKDWLKSQKRSGQTFLPSLQPMVPKHPNLRHSYAGPSTSARPRTPENDTHSEDWNDTESRDGGYDERLQGIEDDWQAKRQELIDVESQYEHHAQQCLETLSQMDKLKMDMGFLIMDRQTLLNQRVLPTPQAFNDKGKGLATAPSTVSTPAQGQYEGKKGRSRPRRRKN